MKKSTYIESLQILVTFTCALVFIFSPHNASALKVHEDMRGPFSSTEDVTQTCLQCHHQQAVEVLQSTHWTWVRQRAVNGKNTLYGKKDSLTGFAIDIPSNPSRCMGCHISNTRPNVDLAAPGPEMVDCLVCHDTTGIYRKGSPGKPHLFENEELELMSQNVGIPSTANCTTCHFADCGLTAAGQTGVASAGKALPLQDVHMERVDTAFSCQDCHARGSGHSFSRKMNGLKNSSTDDKCTSCHASFPHAIDQLNSHTAVITCQACHIPRYAQNKPVMTGWNWIMTGKTNRVYRNRSNSRSLAQDENGFTSAVDLEPVYLWDDGEDNVYSRGQRIRPQELTYLQRPSERSPKSKIAPFRVIYGTQMYDTKYRYLISPLLQPTGSTIFPGSDWENIARQGMQAIILPFSGKYAFAPTAIYRRINHGVTPASEALGCLDCHGSTGRLPWTELGYDQDPLTGNPPAVQKTEVLGRQLNSLPPASFKPVKESVLPPGSIY